MTRFAAFAACMGLIALATSASAHDYQAGNIRIGHPWSRATPPAAAVAGGYLTITNTGKVPDRLRGVSTAIAPTAEIHESTVENGIARMRPLANGLTIKPGQTIELKPGQAHIMFIKPSRPLREKERFAATLDFERAGSVKVEFVVQGMGTQPPGKSDHGEHGAHAR